MYCGDDKYTESWFCLIQAWKDEPETVEVEDKQHGKKNVKGKSV